MTYAIIFTALVLSLAAIHIWPKIRVEKHPSMPDNWVPRLGIIKE